MGGVGRAGAGADVEARKAGEARRRDAIAHLPCCAGVIFDGTPTRLGGHSKHRRSVLPPLPHLRPPGRPPLQPTHDRLPSLREKGTPQALPLGIDKKGPQTINVASLSSQQGRDSNPRSPNYEKPAAPGATASPSGAVAPARHAASRRVLANTCHPWSQVSPRPRSPATKWSRPSTMNLTRQRPSAVTRRPAARPPWLAPPPRSRHPSPPAPGPNTPPGRTRRP